jgi:hypothetical protein
MLHVRLCRMRKCTEAQMMAFLSAAADVVGYAREDEHLRLSTAAFSSPEDLSAQALASAVSQGLQNPRHL